MADHDQPLAEQQHWVCAACSSAAAGTHKACQGCILPCLPVCMVETVPHRELRRSAQATHLAGALMDHKSSTLAIFFHKGRLTATQVSGGLPTSTSNMMGAWACLGVVCTILHGQLADFDSLYCSGVHISTGITASMQQGHPKGSHSMWPCSCKRKSPYHCEEHAGSLGRAP